MYARGLDYARKLTNKQQEKNKNTLSVESSLYLYKIYIYSYSCVQYFLSKATH